jgi:hypothetical protein
MLQESWIIQSEQSHESRDKTASEQKSLQLLVHNRDSDTNATFGNLKLILKNKDSSCATINENCHDKTLISRKDAAKKIKALRARQHRIFEAFRQEREHEWRNIQQIIYQQINNSLLDYIEELSSNMINYSLNLCESIIGTLPTKQRKVLCTSIKDTVGKLINVSPLMIFVPPGESQYFSKLSSTLNLPIEEKNLVQPMTIVLATNQGELTFSFKNYFSSLKTLTKK